MVLIHLKYKNDHLDAKLSRNADNATDENILVGQFLTLPNPYWICPVSIFQHLCYIMVIQNTLLQMLLTVFQFRIKLQ